MQTLHFFCTGIRANAAIKPSFCVIRCSLLFVALLTALICTAPALAADNSIFINTCGQCHYKGGQAAPVNPADKAGLVWIKYFKRQRHPMPLKSLKTQAEMQQVLVYLQDHAADSERPIAAAIPK